MEKAIFYHAGCPVCVSAEQDLLNLLDTQKMEIESVHLGEQPSRLAEAEKAGLKSVPALQTPQGHMLHINFGASLEELKA